MNDIKLAKQNYDCRIEIERDLGKPFRKSSKSWVWKCPFHDDSTPSFHVYKGGYYCYGCQAHGDIFNWWCFWTKRTLSDVLKSNGIDLTPDEIKSRKLEALEKEASYTRERNKKIEAIVKEINDLALWKKYHNNLDTKGRDILEKRGIQQWYQDYRYFGYDPSHRFEFEKGKFFYSPTLVIPFFEPITWKCINIKHRLIGRSVFKYLPEYKDLPQPLFVANPAMPIEGSIVLWEGEFKAAVLYVTDPKLNVHGLPGATPGKEILKQFDKCDPIYLGLDPDSYIRKGKNPKSNYEAIRDFLGKERILSVQLPYKVDDHIVANKLGRDWLHSVLSKAKRD